MKLEFGKLESKLAAEEEAAKRRKVMDAKVDLRTRLNVEGALYVAGRCNSCSKYPWEHAPAEGCHLAHAILWTPAIRRRHGHDALCAAMLEILEERRSKREKLR